MKRVAGIGLILGALGIAGCMHVHGVVLNDRSGEPLRTAVIAVGRPGGIGVYGRHPVDDSGRFSFILYPKDDNNIYVFDSAGPPELTLQKLPSFEFGQPMTVRVRSATPSAGTRPPAPPQ